MHIYIYMRYWFTGIRVPVCGNRRKERKWAKRNECG